MRMNISFEPELRQTNHNNTPDCKLLHPISIKNNGDNYWNHWDIAHDIQWIEVKTTYWGPNKAENQWYNKPDEEQFKRYLDYFPGNGLVIYMPKRRQPKAGDDGNWLNSFPNPRNVQKKHGYEAVKRLSEKTLDNEYARQKLYVATICEE